MAPDSAILTAQELAAIRRDYRSATLLPKRAYQDPGIHDWERREILRRDWIPVGRADEAPEPGSYFLTEIDNDQLIVVRGRDNELRAFHNVCRHRGTAVAEEQCGKVVRLQCPYHAWIYDLDGSLIRAKHTDQLEDFSFESFSLVGVRCEVWQGFVFLNLDPDAAPLAQQLGDLVEHLERFDFGALRSAHRVDYDVSANWKFVAENYQECYHCPGLHPQLNKLTPYDLGSDFMTNGGWQGGYMELAGEAETMALQGGHRNGRPAMAGISPVDERRVYYYLVWPTMFVSVHPDYVLVHWLTPNRVDSTTIRCQWLFEPSTMAAPNFDPSDAIAFWDLTNRQDWHVCELQQRGTRSSTWVAGRYSTEEPSVHAFDLMVADRYAGEGFVSQRLVRTRYDQPPPKPNDANGTTSATGTNGSNGTNGTGQKDGAARMTARSKATASKG
jgi:glycine betaine catabolism A